MIAALAGAALAVGLLLVARGLATARRANAPESAWRTRWSALVRAASGHEEDTRRVRRRVVASGAAGLVVWAVTGWPATGAAVTVGGIWLPWLLGSARVVQDRIARLEALEGWCRRMADTLAGGGAVGLAQAVTVSAAHVDDAVAGPVRRLADRLRDGSTEIDVAVRAFADELDDRVADAVAAAILLALRQQSAGVARVLRQLADGVARDLRARRDIEAARAESRQSLRMLLVIQAGVLVMLALVPTFAAPYTTAAGQVVMAALLSATGVLLVWMRRLALGRRSPRFLVRSGAAR